MKSWNAQTADNLVGFPRVLGQRRFWQLLKLLGSFSLQDLWAKIFQRHRQQQYKRRQAAAISQLLVDLGPCFVKFGQCLATRSDLLPAELTQALAELQDNLPPTEFSLVRQTIEKELQAALTDIFADFDSQPLASASIAQVHRARLKDGRPVAVKVQHPHLSAVFTRDIAYLRLIGKYGLKAGALKDMWQDLTNEMGQTAFAEIDFLQEGRHADALRRLLRPYTRVKIPRILWKYSSRQVLTMEYLAGHKIDCNLSQNRPDVDKKSLCRLLLECYLWQILIGKFFHGDPHSGNLAVDSEGNLLIYDFGIMGKVSTAQNERLANCIQALIKGDELALQEGLKSLNLVTAATQPALSRVLKPLIEYIRGQNLSEIDYKQLESDLEQLDWNSIAELPSEYARLLRMGISLDGILRTLDPQFNFFKHLPSIFQKWWWESGYDLSPRNLFDWKLNTAGSNSYW